MKSARQVLISLILLAAACAESPKESAPAPSAAVELAEARALALLNSPNPFKAGAPVLSRFRFETANALREVDDYLVRRMTEGQIEDDEREPLVRMLWNRLEKANKRPVAPLLSALAARMGSLLEPFASLASGFLFGGQTWDSPVEAFIAIQDLKARLPDPPALGHALYEQAFYRLLAAEMKALLAPGVHEGSGGYPYADAPLLRRMHALEQLRFMPEEVVQSVLASYLYQRILFRESPDPEEQRAFLEPASWSYSAEVMVGRCGGARDSLSGAGIRGHLFGRNCDWDRDEGGTDSDAWVAARDLSTEVSRSSAVIRARMSSFARGGYRSRTSVTSAGAENQTSWARYELHGSATVPACSDPSRCAPLVRISSAGESGASITITSPALSGTVDVPRGGSILVDRSEHPIEIRIRMGRSITHGGACCYPAELTQAVDVSVQEVLPEAPATGESYAASVMKALESRQPDRVLALPVLLSRAGEAKASPTFSERYLDSYGRLLALHWLIEDPVVDQLPSYFRSNLELALAAVSRETRERFGQTISTLVADRQRLVRAIPIVALGKEIVGVLDECTAEATRFDPVLNQLEGLADELDGDPLAERMSAARRELGELSREGGRQFLARAAALMEVQAQLEALQKSLGLQLVRLAAEKSQLAGVVPTGAAQ
jgi:hypothetical protein